MFNHTTRCREFDEFNSNPRHLHPEGGDDSAAMADCTYLQCNELLIVLLGRRLPGSSQTQEQQVHEKEARRGCDCIQDFVWRRQRKENNKEGDQEADEPSREEWVRNCSTGSCCAFGVVPGQNPLGDIGNGSVACKQDMSRNGNHVEFEGIKDSPVHQQHANPSYQREEHEAQRYNINYCN